jgi:hypothetical protein
MRNPNAAIALARRRVKSNTTQAADNTIDAILGDANGQVDAGAGYHWVRRAASADENDNSTVGNAFRAQSNAAGGYYPGSGRRVKLERRGNDWRVKEGSHADMLAAGINPSAGNPLDPYTKFRYLDEIVDLNAYEVAPLLIAVREWNYRTDDNTVKLWLGTTASTHYDLTTHVPASANEQCYALLVFNITEHLASAYPIQVYTSTPITTLGSELGESDLQECYSALPVDEIIVPIKAYALVNGMTGVQGVAADVHLRQMINIPSPGMMLSFDVAADSGTPATIEDADTLTFEGAGGIDTVVDDVTKTVIIDGSAIASAPFVDTTAIVKGSADATKLLRFEVDGFTTGTTRVLTAPNFDGTIATLAGIESFSNKTLTSPKVNEILDSNGNELLKFTTTASAVNELTLANAATGGKPALSATGGDTNIGIDILPKGTGVVNIDGAVVINESGADRDVRIEGDTITNLFFTDASADRIGIGTTSPTTAILDVAGAINVQGDASAVGIYFVPGKAWIRSTGGGFMDVGTAGAGTLNFRMGSGFVSTLLLNNDSTVNIGSIAAGIARLAVYGAASAKALVAVANATGSANIVEAQNSSNTVLASIASTGAGLFNALDASSTSAVTTALTTGHNIAGTPAASFGTGMVFQAKSSTTNDQALGAIDGYWNVASHATRAGQIDIAANYTSTKQVGFSVRGDTGGVKTSVNGATPVARQTAGAATAGATYGATEQTMLQTVYDACRNFGITT